MTKEYYGKTVLLLDGYGRQIPSVLHQLHQLGCKVTVICSSKLDVGYTSRYPQKRVLARGIRDNRIIYEKAITNELKEGYDIVFPVLETATDICTTDDFKQKYKSVKVIAAPREAFLKAYDKQQTMVACMDNGIPCPKTKKDEESLESFISKARFPLAAKPRKGSGSAGFKKIQNKNDLYSYINSGVINIEDYVLQEFISQDSYMCNCYVMMDDSHNPIYSVAIQTYRWYPIDGGPGCFAKTVEQPIVVNSAIKLLKAIDWSGFGQVSFMMDSSDGIPKVTEINGRISAGIKIVEISGCTPVKYLLDRAYGKEIVPMKDSVPEGLGLRYTHTDILWLLKSPNRFNKKPNWFDFRRNVDYIFSWHDPIPFFSYAIEHVLTYKKDMEKRNH